MISSSVVVYLIMFIIMFNRNSSIIVCDTNCNGNCMMLTTLRLNLVIAQKQF